MQLSNRLLSTLAVVLALGVGGWLVARHRVPQPVTAPPISAQPMPSSPRPTESQRITDQEHYGKRVATAAPTAVQHHCPLDGSHESDNLCFWLVIEAPSDGWDIYFGLTPAEMDAAERGARQRRIDEDFYLGTVPE